MWRATANQAVARPSRLVFTLLMAAAAVLAQPVPGRPSFEAASVKPVKAGSNGFGRLRGGPGTNSPGQLSGTATLRALLMRAYGLKTYMIAGPAWMDSERYEVLAKIPAGAGEGQVSLMLQSLLAERFGLVARRETKELPLYSLEVGRSGPKFQKSPDVTGNGPAADDEVLTGRAVPKLVKGADGFPDLRPGSEVPRSYEVVVGGSDGTLYKLWGRRETMQQLADRLSGQLNRPVVDRTGLKDQYDFSLSWTMENVGGGVPRTYPPPDQIETVSTPVMTDTGLSIFSAVQAQLGLRLVEKRGPLEMLIVDRADKIPAGN